MKTTNSTMASMLVLSVVLLTACNSETDTDANVNVDGGVDIPGVQYDGATTAATLDSNNATEFAVGSKAVTVRAITSLSAQSATTVDTSTSRTSHQGEYPCPNGGSITWDTTSSETQNEPNSYQIQYNDCSVTSNENTVVLNGTADYSWSDDGAYTYTYDVTYTENGETQTLTGTYSCNQDGSGCFYADDYDVNGTAYMAENVSIMSDANDTYDISMQLYNEEYGYTYVEGTGLQQCADSSAFQTGSLTITDESQNTVEIQFDNCDTMTVVHQGNSQIVEQ